MITFVLVEPKVPENVGAAARAMNTMGFSQLVLVNPCDHLSEMALAVAHGSQAILRQARVCQDFQSAIDGMDLVIGTTADRRHLRKALLSPEDIAQRHFASPQQNVALVFGREDHGLFNEELLLCDFASSISMAQPSPAVNLGQSVMIYAYALSRPLLPSTVPMYPQTQAPLHELRILQERLGKLLVDLGVGTQHRAHARTLDTAWAMSREQAQLTHYLLGKIEQGMVHPQ